MKKGFFKAKGYLNRRKTALDGEAAGALCHYLLRAIRSFLIVCLSCVLRSTALADGVASHNCND